MTFEKDAVKRQIITLLHALGAEQSMLLNTEATLQEIGLDSLDLAELQVEIESLYEVKLDPDDMPITEEATIGSLIDAVYQHISAPTVQ